MDSQLEVSVSLTRAIVETLRALGDRDPESALDEAGIAPELLARPENRVPFEKQQALWEVAARRSAAPSFGLHFARSIQPASFGLVGYMAMNCGNIDECFEATVRYQSLAGQGGDFTLQRGADTTILNYRPVNPGHPSTPHRVVGLLAANVSFGRWLVGAAYRPVMVEFEFDIPGEQEEYREFFACPVRFGRDGNRLRFAAAVGQLGIPNASEELLLLLSERAERLLRMLSHQSDIANRIASLLASQLTESLPDKSLIAAQMGMSERTLQRRLREEGTSYQAVLDNTRHYLARELLRNTGLSLAEVAARLGFSEPSAFFRAFRKWQGCTPGQYREDPQRYSAATR